MKKITQEDIMKLLDELYTKSIDGIPVISEPIEKLASDYTSRHKDISDAAKEMLDYQVAKCTTSGVLTGFGGIVTLPVTIPANVGSVLYVQMRMIACAAYMGGYDIHSDQVQTLVYACLAGVGIADIVKKFGVAFGEKAAKAAIQKIPGKVLIGINQKVGFRFITKAGETGLINIVKLVPVVGAAINGGFDFVETRIIANRAYRYFIENDFSNDKDEEVIDVDDFMELD